MSKWWIVVAFLVGFLTYRYTEIISPMHEQIHAWSVGANGGIVREQGITYVRFSAPNDLVRAKVARAAHWGELVLYGALALTLRLRLLGGFSFGVLFALPWRALGSSDFQLAASHFPNTEDVWLVCWLAVLSTVVILTLLPVLKILFGEDVQNEQD